MPASSVANTRKLTLVTVNRRGMTTPWLSFIVAFFDERATGASQDY
jgi:hypothetical protein